MDMFCQEQSNNYQEYIDAEKSDRRNMMAAANQQMI
jgi:hypothetical protein